MSEGETTGPACGSVRDAVSARVDGEPAPLTAEEVRDHLDTCHACRSFEEAVGEVTRRTRVAAADPVPDLTVPIVAALDSARPARASRRVHDLRVVVAVAGAVQLLLAVPLVLGLAGPELHVVRDLGAVQLAIGVGLLLAAADPARTHGLLPVVAAVVALSLVTAGVDVAVGRATVVAELPHLTEVVGLVALWALGRHTHPVAVPQPRAVT